MLLPQHRKLIADSAIGREVAEERGYESITTKARLRALGFAANQANVPALLIPVHNVKGEVANYHVRPDQPRVGKQGRVLKYELPTGSTMAIDVPPAVRERLRDPRVPLLITEGVRKADSAVSKGLCCIALLGTWAWRGTNKHGGKALLPDFEHIAWNERQVFVVFDSDVMEKPGVHAALKRLTAVLRDFEADVQVIYLPSGEGGEKVGLDDYLAAGQTPSELLTLAQPELRELPSEGLESEGPYVATEAGIVWRKPGRDGIVNTPLTNFTAQILTDLIEDDGVDMHRHFEIEVRIGDRIERISVPAETFPDLGWVLEQLGGEAIIEALPGAREHVRAAIQHLSGEIEQRTRFAHTGWREVNGVWVYLHAGGAIGPVGPVDGIEVSLPGELGAYELPAPPDAGDLVDAARASLSLLEIGPDEVMFPIVSGIFRAPLGDSGFSLFAAGQTGTFKTAVAALGVQHFGPRMDALNLPISWNDTVMATEVLLFIAKDAFTVVDDFAPGGTSTDVQKAHRDADRVLRSQANRQGAVPGCARMRASRPLSGPVGSCWRQGRTCPKVFRYVPAS